MASTKMKIKKSAEGGHDVMVLAKHPMETGLRKDKKTGERFPHILLKPWSSRLTERQLHKRISGQAFPQIP